MHLLYERSAGAFNLIYVQIGLFIYCIKVYVDTQQIYERVAENDQDVISHALQVFFNIMLTTIIRGEDEKKEK